MAVKSDFGNQILVTSEDGITFDLNKDYTKAIKAAEDAGEDTSALKVQQAAKVASKAYGGKFKTGTEKASLGDTYSTLNQIQNRTANGSPIIVQMKDQETPKTQNEIELAKALSSLQGLYSDNGAYAQALEQQKAANDAAVKKAVGDLQAQKTDTNQSYANMFKQLYVDKMKNQKNINQQMAAQGVNGGAAESTLLGIGTSYEEALRQGEQSRIDAIGDLDKAITDTRLTGDISNAEAAAANAKERTNSYASVLQGLVSRGDNLIAQETARQNSEADSNKAYAYQTAMQILQGGDMVSSDLLTAAGIGVADAEAIVAQAKAAKEQTVDPSENKSYAYKTAMEILQGGGMPSAGLLAAAEISAEDAEAIARQNSGKGTVYSEAQAQLALSAAAGGDRSEAVRSIVEGYYGLPLETVLTAVEGYEPEPVNPVVTDEGWDGVGMKPTHFDAYKRSIVQTIQAGFPKNVQGMIDDIWGGLSPAQQVQLQEELSKLGLRYEQ